MESDRSRKRVVRRYRDGAFITEDDFLATEEPFEIRLVFRDGEKLKDRSLSITMRTPGHDRELAAGFLVGEGIVTRSSAITSFESTGPLIEGTDRTNQLCVHLADDVEFDLASLQRNFYTTSSCGICGKASLDAVRAQLDQPLAEDDFFVSAAVIRSLPNRLRDQQGVFDQTGGLHAAGLFDGDGEILASFEDVGRHNALDKLVGHELLAVRFPLADRIVVVSGRASFELVQKAISAGAAMLVAVGAPSSLAAELADEFNLTLIGFAAANRFNVYSHANRVID